MTVVNIHDAKTNLSKYIQKVQNGEPVIICKRNIPIAELKAYKPIKGKRKLGQCKHKIIMHDSFFDPLPDDLLEAFN
jgi:prevent-host-death family protein